MAERTGYEQLNAEEGEDIDIDTPNPEEIWLGEDDNGQLYNDSLPLSQRIIKNPFISTSAPPLIKHSRIPQYHDDEESRLLDPFRDGSSNSPNLSASPPSYQTSSRNLNSEPIIPRARARRSHSIMSIDLKSINDKVSKWTSSITKWTLGSNSIEPITNEIQYSVFKPPLGVEPLKKLPEEGFLNTGPVTKHQFNLIVEDAINAIERGISPKRIAAGSSGSYFIYNSEGKVVGVFKPKDEEPYGPLSPKWTKWLHRNLFPCFFGRSCLIPNLGYICESAASLLDKQLQSDIVPYTDTVYISSDTFYYSYWDRRAHRVHKKPLDLKIGSFQLFLDDYQEADKFISAHPLPGSRWTLPTLYNSSSSNSPQVSNNENQQIPRFTDDRPPILQEFDMDNTPVFQWTEEAIQQFREELEKLVILDYIMRNTDRGLDNWMIKLEWHTKENGRKEPHLKIGAIDSGLSWPWKHPDEWRSYPFGWLFLPVSIIGQPFSEKTRQHYLPLLTSTVWWEESSVLFRELFARDDDFKERIWKKQWAVMKGQAFNVVETLKNPTQGPLELARRTRILVWDEEMEVPVHIPVSVMSNAIETPIHNDHDHKKATPKPLLEPINEDSDLTHSSPIKADPVVPKIQNDWSDLLAGEINEERYQNQIASPLSRKKHGLGFVQDTMATKRVIIERLQTVTSKPPVFTWC